MRFRSEVLALAALGTAACSPTSPESRVFNMQDEYGMLQSRLFYTTGHQVQCEMFAENGGKDPAIACAGLIINTEHAETKLEDFRTAHPVETAILDRNCEASAITGVTELPLFAYECQIGSETR